MAEVPLDYVNAIATALLVVPPVPSAIDDITRRLLEDRPSDLVAYLEDCRKVLPSYFAPVQPQAPTAEQLGYDKWFINNLETVAGVTPPPPTAEAPRPPATLSQSDPAYSKKFAQFADAIARGETEVVA